MDSVLYPVTTVIIAIPMVMKKRIGAASFHFIEISMSFIAPLFPLGNI
jgi:hypothetical protein